YRLGGFYRDEIFAGDYSRVDQGTAARGAVGYTNLVIELSRLSGCQRREAYLNARIGRSCLAGQTRLTRHFVIELQTARHKLESLRQIVDEVDAQRRAITAVA